MRDLRLALGAKNLETVVHAAQTRRHQAVVLHDGAHAPSHAKENLPGVVVVGVIRTTEIAFRADDARVLQTGDPTHDVDVMNEQVEHRSRREPPVEEPFRPVAPPLGGRNERVGQRHFTDLTALDHVTDRAVDGIARAD